VIQNANASVIQNSQGAANSGCSTGNCKHSANLANMTDDNTLTQPTTKPRKEPAYLYSEKQVAEKSKIAQHFLDTRTRLNQNVDKADNLLVKRFYNLDHNTYLEGALPAKYKELMGLVASACLRCDDCVDYHVIQSYRLGATRAEQQEAINVALVIGGSIVIPHMRRAYELLAELYA
jgi:AhpD family alkylhydroperoxidase